MTSQLSGASRLFPIIGDPIRYVESPVWLTNTFAGRGHNGICVPMQVPDGGLGVVMAGLTAITNVDGILVTMPHKHAAFAYCATSSGRATLLGAVSVIRRNANGTWHGDMLDGGRVREGATGPWCPDRRSASAPGRGGGRWQRHRYRAP